MYSTTDFRKGLKIEFNGEPYIIVDFQHVKPGKGPAFVRVKQQNLRSGATVERTYRTDEKIEDIRVENREMQYLYMDGTNYVFMDNETYEQHFVNEKLIGDKAGFLLENANATVMIHGSDILDVNPPTFLEVRIVKTDPGVRGDTAQGGSKPAVLESGATIQVPLFINEGDMVKVDTRDGRYIERVKE